MLEATAATSHLTCCQFYPGHHHGLQDARRHKQTLRQVSAQHGSYRSGSHEKNAGIEMEHRFMRLFLIEKWAFLQRSCHLLHDTNLQLLILLFDNTVFIFAINSFSSNELKKSESASHIKN